MLPTLPDELKVEVLLLTSPDTLTAIFSVDRNFYSLGAEPYFWHRRFLREGLPIPIDEPIGRSGWLRTYLHSNNSATGASEDLHRISEGEILDVQCIDPQHVWIYDVPGIDFFSLVSLLEKDIFRRLRIYWAGGIYLAVYSRRRGAGYAHAEQDIKTQTTMINNDSLYSILFHLRYFRLPYSILMLCYDILNGGYQ